MGPLFYFRIWTQMISAGDCFLSHHFTSNPPGRMLPYGVLHRKNRCHDGIDRAHLRDFQETFACSCHLGLDSARFRDRDGMALYRHQGCEQRWSPGIEYLLAGYPIPGTVYQPPHFIEKWSELLCQPRHIHCHHLGMLLRDGDDAAPDRDQPITGRFIYSPFYAGLNFISGGVPNRMNLGTG